MVRSHVAHQNCADVKHVSQHSRHQMVRQREACADWWWARDRELSMLA